MERYDIICARVNITSAWRATITGENSYGKMGGGIECERPRWNGPHVEASVNIELPFYARWTGRVTRDNKEKERENKSARRRNARVSGSNGTKDLKEDVHYRGSRKGNARFVRSSRCSFLLFGSLPSSSKQTEMGSLRDACLYVCEKNLFLTRICIINQFSTYKKNII